ncbi:MAG: GGDEF domain-containing protein [Nitrospirae bacterium]|nr:GGDEF domain-containing protein [Nitrospirota bacterium]
MRQRLKGFLLFVSISFLLVYAASEYFARRVDAEVEVANQRLVILYNAHKVIYNIEAIQEGLYSLLIETSEDPDYVTARFPDLEQGVKNLSTSVSYIYYVGKDDPLFRTYSHHVEVIDTIYPKFIDKIKTAVEAKEKRERERYLREAIETGEGMEAIVRELNKFLEQEYKKINSSFSIASQEMRWIRNVTGGLFFIAIVILSYLMFYSCRPFKKALLPFLETIKAGDYANACRIKGEDDGCSNEIISGFNTIIDKIKEGEKASESLTITDPLTGAYNRRYLDIRLAEEMNRSIRYGTIFSISLIDIDHFKEINDTFGHQVGDSVLKELVMLMKANSRETDIMARYGGEEFIIIYPCTPKSGVLTQVERLREVVEGYKLKELERPVTISIGGADSAGKITAEQVIQEADSNLYLAKNRGRNRCVITGVTA